MESSVLTATRATHPAVSYHGSCDILADTVQKLSRYKNKNGSKLKQINVHFMTAEETYNEAIKLFELIKTDNRFEDLNAVVFLGLKQCGRATKAANAKNGFSKLNDRAL